MEPLTKKQQQILNFISDFIYTNNYSPSYREIAEKFNLSSVATVAEHINSLKIKGYLDSEPNLARSVQINSGYENENYTIPLLGFIAAGFPIEAIKTNETLDIPRDMNGRNVFALKVKGDSMIDDGILDGDYIIIEQCNNPRNGDIVVALVGKDNVTLKRFYKEKKFIRLQPSNKKYSSIIAKNVKIQGKIKGVIRKF